MCYDPDYRKKTRSLAWQKAEKIIKRLNDSYKIATDENNNHIFNSEFNCQIDIAGVRSENAIAGIYWSYLPSKGGAVFYYFGTRNEGGKPAIQVCEENDLKSLIFEFLKLE